MDEREVIKNFLFTVEDSNLLLLLVGSTDSSPTKDTFQNSLETAKYVVNQATSNIGSKEPETVSWQSRFFCTAPEYNFLNYWALLATVCFATFGAVCMGTAFSGSGYIRYNDLCASVDTTCCLNNDGTAFIIGTIEVVLSGLCFLWVAIRFFIICCEKPVANSHVAVSTHEIGL
jgi:hypothetical protein